MHFLVISKPQSNHDPLINQLHFEKSRDTKLITKHPLLNKSIKDYIVFALNTDTMASRQTDA